MKLGRRQLVLVGGGHAHVFVLEAFASVPPPDCDVTVVVDTPIAMYSGMVPGFVAGDYQRRQLEIDIPRLAERAGAAVVDHRATRIDAGRRVVEVDGAEPVAYDVASLDVGSTVIGDDLPGVREHALAVRPIVGFVDRVPALIERARRHDPAQAFKVVVVGGGAGGVELAMTFRHRLGGRAGPTEVALLEAGPRILDGAPDALVRRVERLLAKRGIAVHAGRRASIVEADGVVLDDGGRVEADAVIWVAGPTGRDLLKRSPLSVDDRGCLRVRSTLQAEHHDDLFAAGDCAMLIEHPWVPRAGVYAVRQGPVLARNLRGHLAGGTLEPYRPQRDFLTLMNAGGGTALGTKWGLAFQGRWVMWLKDRIDRKFVGRFQV